VEVCIATPGRLIDKMEPGKTLQPFAVYQGYIWILNRDILVGYILDL
jgi:hypothetical protein